MRHQSCSLVCAAVLGVAAIAPIGLAAQEGNTVSTPPAYSPQRTSDGQPDIQGYYYGTGTGLIEPSGFFGYGESSTGVSTGAYDGVWSADRPGRTTNRTAAPPAPGSSDGAPRRPSRTDSPDGSIPYQPWSRARKLEYIKGSVGDPRGAASIEMMDPVMRCLPAGVPRMTTGVYSYNGVQILQPAGYVVILAEWNHLYRIIPLDGRPHLSSNVRLWMGDSRGRWEGNTLVVDWTNSNGRTWLDQTGSFHSDAIHVVERFTIVDKDSMRYEATVEDPSVFSRPWKYLGSFNRAEQPDYELYEYACAEGNRAVDNALIKK
jgi:hypothetical protein